MNSYVRHIALVVPDLREAESYYQSLFQMELIGREVELEDGEWYTLPPEKSWEDEEAAGIDLDMLALRKGDIVLALFQGSNPLGQVFAIGLAMPREQADEVRKQLEPEVEVTRDREGHFHFRDRYGILWQLVPPGDEFFMNGDVSGRWLEVKVNTFHALKGLEFDTVFLSSLQETSVRGGSEDEKSSERRLAYMAMTRARERLYMGYQGRLPSKYLSMQAFVDMIQ